MPLVVFTHSQEGLLESMPCCHMIMVGAKDSRKELKELGHRCTIFHDADAQVGCHFTKGKLATAEFILDFSTDSLHRGV